MNTFTFLCIWYENSFIQMKRSWSDSQSSSGDVVHVFMSSLRRYVHFCVCVCVCVCVVGKRTSLLHIPFFSARYLSLLFRWAWAVTEQNDRAEHVTRRSDDGWGRGETCTLLGGAVYILGCRKFSATVVHGQNDSSRHIICLNDFLYHWNRFSPKP